MMSGSTICVLAFCGYVALAIVLFLPISVAAAIGGIIARIANSPTIGAWIAGMLGVALTIGLAAGLYYYNTHLAGGPPDPDEHFRQFVGFSIVGSVIGGVGSFLMCRAMR